MKFFFLCGSKYPLLQINRRKIMLIQTNFTPMKKALIAGFTTLILAFFVTLTSANAQASCPPGFTSASFPYYDPVSGCNMTITFCYKCDAQTNANAIISNVNWRVTSIWLRLSF
jgi:hypothetical protein